MMGTYLIIGGIVVMVASYITLMHYILSRVGAMSVPDRWSRSSTSCGGTALVDQLRNAADEKLHEYRSPDATAPERLSSRFELGVAGPANALGQFHATHRDFPVPDRGRELVLLDTRETEGGGDWCGHHVGTTYQFTEAGKLGTLEGDPRFFFDDSLSPQCQGTGREEWGGGGDYWGGRKTA